MGKAPYYVIWTLCLLVGAACLGGIGYELWQFHRSDAITQELEGMKLEQVAHEPPAVLQPTQPEEGLTEETAVESQRQIPWETMRERIPDLVGWLEGAEVNDPIVQGEDNGFYLSHLPTKESNVLGSIFLDFRSPKDFSSEISIIYGHNANKKRMFGPLEHYRSQEYYEANPWLTLYTPEGNYRVVLLAAFLANGGRDYYPTGFSTQEEKMDYINQAMEQSLFQSEAEPSPEGSLLLLSTCVYDFQNARLALLAQLEELESTSEETL